MRWWIAAILLLLSAPAFGATTGQLIVIHPSAGSSTVLDLGDDGTDESTGLLEIATTGDANSIATSPSTDKLLLDFSIPWLAADVASAGDDALNFFPAGAFEDARISQSSVTQHQSALTITESQVSDLSHTVDTDTTCLDAGVDCLFAGSATEGGAATSALDLSCTGCVAASEVAADVATQAELDAVAGAESDDQTGTEVPYTPTTAGDWTDPDPVHVAEGLDDLAGRLTTEEAKAEQNDLTAAVTWANVPDANIPPEIARDSEVPSLETDPGVPLLALADLGDLCAASESTRRNATDTANECYTPGAGAPSFDAITSGTNTSAAMVCGAGCSVKVASTGSIGASVVDADGDGNANIRMNGSILEFDTDDNGSDEFRSANGQLYAAAKAAVRFDVNQSPTTAQFLMNVNQNSGFGGASNAPSLVVSGISKLTASATEVTINAAQVNSPSTATCADSGDANPGFVVITPTTSEVYLTVSDPDGCSVTISESGAAPGQRLEITVVSIAGGTANFADSSGVQEMGTGCSLPLYGTLGAKYIDTVANDRWVKRFCETNV